MEYRIATAADLSALAEIRWDFRTEEAPVTSGTGNEVMEYQVRPPVN